MKLTIETVQGAVTNNVDAMVCVLQRYDGYITALSSIEYTDEYGIPQKRFDPDKKCQLQAKLITAVGKFSIERCLQNEYKYNE